MIWQMNQQIRSHHVLVHNRQYEECQYVTVPLNLNGFSLVSIRGATDQVWAAKSENISYQMIHLGY